MALMRDMRYPHPTSQAASSVMRGNRKRDTRPEVRLRSALHRRGLRFFKDRRIEGEGLRVRGDVVFPRNRVAVFVDGCFWHGCPDHGNTPRANSSYWVPKLARNKERDREQTAALEARGWTVIRIWEHVPPDEAADFVQATVRSPKSRASA